jgi:hypothetical protein
MSDEDDLDRAVAVYDRELVPWLFEHWAEPMVDLIAPEPSSRIVDLACGSGRHLSKSRDAFWAEVGPRDAEPPRPRFPSGSRR